MCTAIGWFVVGVVVAMMFGRASRIGHSEERSKKREKVDVDTEFL